MVEKEAMERTHSEEEADPKVELEVDIKESDDMAWWRSELDQYCSSLTSSESPPSTSGLDNDSYLLAGFPQWLVDIKGLNLCVTNAA